ncbi:hypothetical protein E2C01_036755 [Portunus trituberculatus]|uniref:Uncharacterized protein n=1 Tax=Portunus trituberculatus TaxID=210409 RepID=A0A5B7FDI7_PORTR|nr:hypothetical protein [Portunus trituberculatus]
MAGRGVPGPPQQDEAPGSFTTWIERLSGDRLMRSPGTCLVGLYDGRIKVQNPLISVMRDSVCWRLRGSSRMKDL